MSESSQIERNPPEVFNPEAALAKLLTSGGETGEELVDKFKKAAPDVYQFGIKMCHTLHAIDEAKTAGSLGGRGVLNVVQRMYQEVKGETAGYSVEPRKIWNEAVDRLRQNMTGVEPDLWQKIKDYGDEIRSFKEGRENANI